MRDLSPSAREAEKMQMLYEMAGFSEDPRDKDLIVEAKWLLESQFMVIIAACEKYSDTLDNWEKYVNAVVVPRVIEFLKEKSEVDQAVAGTLVQNALSALQSKLELDKAHVEKIHGNILLLGGTL